MVPIDELDDTRLYADSENILHEEGVDPRLMVALVLVLEVLEVEVMDDSGPDPLPMEHLIPEVEVEVVMDIMVVLVVLVLLWSDIGRTYILLHLTPMDDLDTLLRARS